MHSKRLKSAFVFCVLLFCLPITGCSKKGVTGNYPDLGTLWWGATMQTAENGMAVPNPTWGNSLDISVVQDVTLSTNTALLGGLNTKLEDPRKDSELSLNYTEEGWSFGALSSATYTGSGALLDENNAQFTVTVDITDPLFGDFNGTFEVKMTRLNEEHMPIDDRVDVDSGSSASSALMSSIPMEILEHVETIASSLPSVLRDAFAEAYLHHLGY